MTLMREYPFLPKSTVDLEPGQFWDIPLSDGSFGCGRIIELEPRSMTVFLAGLLDWKGTRPPTASAISGSACVAQGAIHLKTIRELGGQIRGLRPIEDDEISAWLFRESMHRRGSHVQRGFTRIRDQNEDDGNLPVFATWGLRVIGELAEQRFVANSYCG